jgi:hypothetical protein
MPRTNDVVRYFKNERFGFSVTYYEGNRPRQYYPYFIVTAREDDGREVMWIAETKGEIPLFWTTRVPHDKFTDPAVALPSRTYSIMGSTIAFNTI